MEDKKHPKTADQYIKEFPQATQEILRNVRDVIREVIPGAEEVISYGIPTFKVNNHYVMYYSGWKDHISLYPIPKGDEDFQKTIAPYKAGKGTLRFSLSEPIPYEVIKEVAKRHFEEMIR